MSDSPSSARGEADASVWIARRDPALRARFERLHALEAIWELIAPLDVSVEGGHIGETGRAVGSELARLARQAHEDRDHSVLRKLDKLLDAMATEIPALAFQVPVAELRATLPSRLPEDRRGILELLDMMLVAEIDGDEGSAGRVSAIDYLITLLCTGGPEGPGDVLDPVGLTPRLHELCERTDDADPRLAEIAAEFYAAAQVDEQDAREELQLRALRRRKRELGSSFYAPSVLRAIVTYNAALSRCIERGVFDSRDWGTLPTVSDVEGDPLSVFDTEVLPRLGESLRRRAEGRAPTSSAIDRVAWCLELGELEDEERAALLSPSIGQPDGLEGTVILVGLLCRSAVVLDGEIPAIGIVPDTLHLHWVRELDDAIKQLVNARITSDAYEEARRLSELRTRFLYTSMSDVHRERRRTTPVADPRRLAGVEAEARQLADEALEHDPVRGRSSLDWARLGRIAGAVVTVALCGLGLAFLVFHGDLDRLSGSELDRVSPYLARGARNGEGKGPAFVGTLTDAWTELSADLQQGTASQLVDALRAEGVRDVMVYDDDRRLRIQALGEQPLRVLPATR